ncbi:hypothetical protein [Mycobacterium sp.]|uniref:hypothetical protein n=1 Tax=Mycobacterium sp. TaxID=1785 RepID=UPI001285AFBF|nr:hypothetical protein [Mycobacterium sp.]KAA8960760.1 MAG: hypothetical protein F6Q13_13280 [Mycobacterium sp.]
MEFAELAHWTPIRLDFSGPAPAVYWADLTGVSFVEPFFDQTVAGWAARTRARPLVRTGLDALQALDGEPSLQPAGMVFHLSRCGSTLVSRLLGTVPGVVVLAEPAPLNALLGLDPNRLDEVSLVRTVRLVVRALARSRHGELVVLKCSSWNIRRRAVLAAAFPETPWVWVQREPARVLASLFAKPPDWLRVQAAPAQAAWLFGLDPAAVPAMTRVEFAARTLGAMLAAAAAEPAQRLCIDHADLPAAVWRHVLGHFGLQADAATIDRMIAESRFYAKDPLPRAFAGDGAQSRRISEEMRAAARQFADPGYRALTPHT